MSDQNESKINRLLTGTNINALILGILFVIVGSQYGIRYEISSLEESLLQKEDVLCVKNEQERGSMITHTSYYRRNHVKNKGDKVGISYSIIS